MSMLTPSQSVHRDWYLARLGIRLYQPRDAQLFRGETGLLLSDATHLVVISENNPSNHPFFHDVLAAVNLKNNAWIFIAPNKIVLLPDDLPCVIWAIGTIQNMDLLNRFSAVIHTESISKIAISTLSKRILWQKLCQYALYF